METDSTFIARRAAAHFCAHAALVRESRRRRLLESLRAAYELNDEHGDVAWIEPGYMRATFTRYIEAGGSLGELYGVAS